MFLLQFSCTEDKLSLQKRLCSDARTENEGLNSHMNGINGKKETEKRLKQAKSPETNGTLKSGAGRRVVGKSPSGSAHTQN